MAYHNNPRIVTEDLVLCLDAADKVSAPHNDLPVKKGLVGWWDANDDSTVTFSGSNVTQWRDKSGNSNHMSVPSSYSGPTRGNTLNSKKVLTFTQSNGLESTLNLSSSNYTVLGVSRYTATGQIPTNSPAAGRVIQANSNNWLLGHHNAGTQRHYAAGWVTSAGTDDTNWRIYSGTGDISGDVYKFYVVGTENTQNSSAGSAGPNGLGINTGYAEHSACEGAEIIAFNRVLSDDERTKVHSYLQNKWNITVSGGKWNDKTTNGYNGTLVNGLTYADTNKGYFEFDGSSDYIDGPFVSLNPGAFTYESVVYRTSTGFMASGNGTALGGGTYLQAFLYDSGVRVNLYAPQGYSGGWKTGSTIPNVSNTFVNGNIYHVTIVNINTTFYFYKNGVLLGSYDHGYLTSIYSQRLAILRGAVQSVGGTGRVYLCRLYDKALSASQVLQNFNATKGRFGL